MRYANVLLELVWLNGPNGDARLRSREPAKPVLCGGEREAERRRRDSYCDSREFSMFL